MAVIRMQPRLIHLSAFELLINRGAHVNAKTTAGETALQEASARGSLRVVKRLLEHGADVHATTEAGETALHWAAGYGNAEVVRLLLQHGADAKVTTELGQTPLHWADRNGNHDAKQLLSTKMIAKDPGADSVTGNRACHKQPSDAVIWAVLIGIDLYAEENAPGPEGQRSSFQNLHGCVNDALLAERYLGSVMGVQPSHIRKLVTGFRVNESNAPTYSNIIQALESTADAAAPGDSVYIHYSGYSGRASTAFPSLRERGHTDGVLIPADFNSGGRPLRDLELEYLVRKMVQKGLAVTVVLDCCEHFLGTAAKGPQCAPPNLFDLPDDLPAYFDNINKFFDREEAKNQGKSLSLQPSGYTLFGTSHATETQRDGKIYGTLTYLLMSLLQDGFVANSSCRTIHRRLSAEMRRKGKGATPILLGEADRLFHTASTARLVGSDR